jgi:hypothetical protein
MSRSAVRVRSSALYFSLSMRQPRGNEMALNVNIEGVATVATPPETLALTSSRCGRLWRMPLYGSGNKCGTKKSRRG